MTSLCEPRSWTQSRRPEPCQDRCRGFTLIELLVALAVLGLALALIAGYKPPWSRGLGVQATAAELAAGLRLARSEAILTNRPVAFDLDLIGHRYRVGTGAPRRLPADLSIELLTISGEAAVIGQRRSKSFRWQRLFITLQRYRAICLQGII